MDRCTRLERLLEVNELRAALDHEIRNLDLGDLLTRQN